VKTIDLWYIAGSMPDDFLSMRKKPKMTRTLLESKESAWQKRHSRETTGPEQPLHMRVISAKERAARIQHLIQKGLGDGSIAVRLNREGIECSRADVFMVRTGHRPPDGSGTLEETSVIIDRSS
jgi:hypothetical protein